MALTIGFVRLEHGRGLAPPLPASQGAAGFDLSAAVAEETPLVIAPGERAVVPTGLALMLPAGVEAQIRPRSGLAAKHGVTVLNAPGTVDADYRGEVKVILINHGERDFIVNRGDRIAQMVVAPVAEAELVERAEADRTERGSAGFGSTGTGAMEEEKCGEPR